MQLGQESDLNNFKASQDSVQLGKVPVLGYLLSPNLYKVHSYPQAYVVVFLDHYSYENAMVQQKVQARSSQGKGCFLFYVKEFTTEPGYEQAVYVVRLR